MKRRDFLRYAGAAGGAVTIPELWSPRPAEPAPAARAAQEGVDPLPVEAFRGRLDRASALIAERGWAAIFAEPSTNFEYLVGADFWRSERLIALIVPVTGKPVIVAPDFELERVERAVGDLCSLRGWTEQQDPYAVAADLFFALRSGPVGIEPSTRYGVAMRLQAALSNRRLADAEPVFARLRIIKSDAEIALIRRAVSITETSIAATFASLEAGLTDTEVAAQLSRQMRDRGVSGGGLVQFGPTSALPHAGTEGRRLERGMPVLIDAGSRVHGYTSDITRMHFFGDETPPEYREVHNTVFTAQTAAFEAGKPGMESQQLDRIARRVIVGAGYARYFTHRLGHGIGMDGHEPPYLVEGNRRRLEPGMVFTIEPGIYLPGRWGVRIEDDFVVTGNGLEPLSSRVGSI